MIFVYATEDDEMHTNDCFVDRSRREICKRVTNIHICLKLYSVTLTVHLAPLHENRRHNNMINIFCDHHRLSHIISIRLE
jgi:hypothetical protein